MSRRRGGASIAANPVLIGAATTLVVIVAVFLAYNANNGLPFVPTYDIKAEVPNAANLVPGNEVRISGTRVGVINDITTQQRRSGAVVAVLHLKLQTSVQELAKDSTVLVRPRSALGLKYLQITEGTSKDGYQNGATIPLRNAKPPVVEIDDLFNTFDTPTRLAQQQNLLVFGNALAGRGSDINSAIGALNPLLTGLIPVARNLSSRRTRLGELFPALNRVATIVAPAAETQASLFRNLDTTFSGLSDVARPFIQDTIQEGPPTLDQAIESFRFERAPLANATGLFRDLRPGVQALRAAGPDISAALAVGTPALARSPELNRRLATTFRTLETFARDPFVPIALTDLNSTVSFLAPTLDYLTPTQTNCNYVTLFFRNAANLLSEGDKNGTWQRFTVINPTPTPTGDPVDVNSQFGPSSAPDQGPVSPLHATPYPNVGAPGQPKECEAGNEPYSNAGPVIGNAPGTQPLSTEATTNTVTAAARSSR